jgi:hypothetical protein
MLSKSVKKLNVENSSFITPFYEPLELTASGPDSAHELDGHFRMFFTVYSAIATS